MSSMRVLVGLALVLAALYPRRVTSLGAAASRGMTVVIAVALVLATGIVVVAFGDMGANHTQFQLSLAGSSGPRTQIDLEYGESKNVRMTYDTGNLDTDSIGESKLKATSNNDKNAEMVTIEAPTLVLGPTVEYVRAGQERLNHTIGFTPGEDPGPPTIDIDLTDTTATGPSWRATAPSP
jgi:hypothetical protein